MPPFGKIKISTDHYARQLLRKVNITTPPINPREIIKQLPQEVLLQEADFSSEFDGCVFQKDGKAMICLNAAIPSETRKNFTLAHELGHYVIPDHKRNPKCQRQDIEAFDSITAEEAEANEFASELLMPESIIQPLVEESEIGFDTVKKIAGMCGTSLTSSVHRYMKFTPYLAILVVCQKGILKYPFFSKKMFRYKADFRKGMALNKNCLAIDFFEFAGKVIRSDSKQESVLPGVWFSTVDSSMVECREEAIGFPNYDLVMSLIWIEPKETEIDYDE